MKPESKYAAGLRGQKAAATFLRAEGMEILQENYRIRGGEIDIIARDGEYIVFVEVKFRTGLGFGRPAEAVNYAKQKKIIHTASHYIAAKNLINQDFRFDVVEVLQHEGVMYAKVIKDAFWA